MLRAAVGGDGGLRGSAWHRGTPFRGVWGLGGGYDRGLLRIQQGVHGGAPDRHQGADYAGSGGRAAGGGHGGAARGAASRPGHA
eukprot:3063310-Pyramimonas_sp.AAC.1